MTYDVFLSLKRYMLLQKFVYGLLGFLLGYLIGGGY